MNSAPVGRIPEPSSWELLKPACDEAVLPAGIKLADETRAGRQCFMLLEGTATVEAAGNRLRELGAGAFVGHVGQGGRPLPPSGLTVQLATRARVLVIDARRLAELVDSDPAAAGAWRQLYQSVGGPWCSEWFAPGAARHLASPQALPALEARHSMSGTVPILRVRLLGGFCVERADTGQAISEWPRRSAKTLIKLLAIYPGHALHREQVIDTLWPDADAESALNSFGKALYAARRALQPKLPRRQDSAYLRLADAMVVLHTEHVIVDVDQFERLAADAMRQREIEAYQTALSAYGGELLPEDRYEDWCSERRGVLAELHIRVLLGLAEIFEDHGAFNEAAERLRDVLGQDPTREAVQRRLIRLYARMGAPNLAVRQFHACQDVLRRDLGLPPQSETVLLHEEILAGRTSWQRPALDRIRDLADVRDSPPAGTGYCGPFVGRERVIQYMCDQLARRAEAQPGMVIVSGEPGVGKTRLLEEFTKRACAQGVVTLYGGRGAHASQFACGPIAVALEDYAARLPPADRKELAHLYPALTWFVPSLGSGVPISVPVRDYHLELVPSVVQFLTDLARTKPVLLVLGDLHEADPVGLDLIRYLAHLAVRVPLLMVGALRDPDIELSAGLRRMTEAMTRERLWLRIDLRCLSRSATDQLVRAMLPDSQVSEAGLKEIYAQSRGNPLFVRELVHGMRSCDGRAPACHRFQGASWLAARSQGRPRALTAMRMALLDDPLRRVLGLTAAAGDTGISLGELRAAAAALDPPLAVPVLFDALDRALRMHLLEECDEGYAFRHPVLRMVLYDSLPRHRRDELHTALIASGT